MLLGLGGVLVANPTLLQRPLVGIALLVAALLATGAIVLARRMTRP